MCTYLVLPAAGLPARHQPGQLHNWKSRWAVIFSSQRTRQGLTAHRPMNICFPRTDALGAKIGNARDNLWRCSSLKKRIFECWDFSITGHVNTAAVRNTSFVKSESTPFLWCLDLISSKPALYKNMIFSQVSLALFPRPLYFDTEERKQSIKCFRNSISYGSRVRHILSILYINWAITSTSALP